MWGKPYSAFDLQLKSREDLKESLLQRNQQRYRSSLRYIKKLNKLDNITENRHCELSIGIVTVSRMYGNSGTNVLGYLTQVAHHIHKETRNTSTCLSICDVHAGPGNHTEAKKLVPYFHTYIRFPEPSATHVIMDVFEREKQDYSFCLEKLLQHNSQEVLLFEDDAVPVHNFYRVLREIIDGLTSKNSNWGYLKLFYPPRWQGYSFEIQKLKELILIGMAGAFLFFKINFIMAWIKSCGLSLYRTFLCFDTVMIAVFGFLYAVCIALCIGRQNILEMYRSLGYYHTVPAPGCCSPAILYKRNTSQMIVEHFRTTKCSPHYPLDRALDSFREAIGIDAYLVEPSLVWHIGLVSTLKGISHHLEEFMFY